ncbi:Fc receptor-like protein 5 isoform X1 [Epinephelus lanceolatus]
MEVTALCFRLLMLKLTLLNTQRSDAAFLHITPNRLQHFEYESVSFNCEGIAGPTRLRGVRNTQEFNPVCDIKRTPTGSSCTVDKIYPADSGEYWCETEGGERSNSVNISVTDGSVLLDSPVLPVMEGNNVTLTCRNKTNFPHLTAGFYKDGLLIRSSSTGEMTIHSVSKSDEGLYKCHISGAGESPESWMAVRAGSVILESPVLPVEEGNNVTLTCRKKMSSLHLTAGFYKDGLLIRSSSTGRMTIHSVSKSDEGLYKCHISGAGGSPESWMAVRGGDVILESPALPVTEGEAVTLRCRNKKTPSDLRAGFYKDGILIRNSSTGEMTISSVSKSDEGLYKCRISGAGESVASLLAVREINFSRLYYILLWVAVAVILFLQLLVLGLLYWKKQLVLLEAKMYDTGPADCHQKRQEDKKENKDAADATDNVSLNHGAKPETEKDEGEALP